MDKIKEVKQIINNHAFPSVYYDGKVNQGFIKDIDGTFDRIAEEIVKLFTIPDVKKIKTIRYYINDEIVKKEMTGQSKECSHEIIRSNIMIVDTKYRYCKHCGMLAHEDNSFSYCCGMEYCMCMQ